MTYLQLIAPTGGGNQHHHVHHLVHKHLGLAKAHRFHQHVVKPRGLTQQDQLVGVLRDAAQKAARRRRPHKRGGFVGQAPHARLVPQDRAAGAGG